ncbi:MAG: flagellar hook-associated protein FlgL [Desulfomonilia bacterium]
MKVSNRFLYYQLVKDLESSTEKLFKLNGQISSGKRIDSPSEDPIGLSSVLLYRTELNAFDQFKKSIDHAHGWLSRMDAILIDIDDLLSRATELAVQASSSTATADTREGAAEEIMQIRSMILSHANSKYGDKYMFGGTRTQSSPFLWADVENWQDDVQEISASPPASPVDGDRYIDSADNHIYQYDGASSSWVDQGEPAEGSSVWVEDAGDLYIFSQGQWESLYQGNSSVTSIQIGKGDNVPMNIPGDELFSSSQGNIFMTLMTLERALRDNDQEGIRGQLTELEDSSKVLMNKLARIGSVVNRLEHTTSVIERATVDTQERVSLIEDLDYAAAITSLQNQQTIYQAQLKSASLITSLSLVDYV